MLSESPGSYMCQRAPGFSPASFTLSFVSSQQCASSTTRNDATEKRMNVLYRLRLDH